MQAPLGWCAEEHKRGSTALKVNARKFHAPCPYQRNQTIVKRLDILLQHCRMDCRCYAILLVGISHQEILFERLTAQTRDLRGIGALRRDKELLRMLDALPIPEHLTCLPGK